VLAYLASPTNIASMDGLDADALVSLAAIASGDRASPILVVRDPRPWPGLDALLSTLSRLRPVRSLDRVVPNPRSADVDAMAAEARAFGPGAVLAFGGGSTLDSAKAVAALVANPGDLDDYLGPTPQRRLERKGATLACLPTTTGTGAEVTRFGVYTSREGRKLTLASPYLQPDHAVLAASFVAELPEPVVAATGFDAISHALEALWNRNATPRSDEAAIDALCACLAAYGKCLESPSPKSKAAMLAAACASGCAFNLTGTALIHALSFPLSERWRLNHGEACAFFADEVFALNAADTAVASKLARAYRRSSGEALKDDEAVDALFAAVSSLRKKAALPDRFSALPGAPGEKEALEAFATTHLDGKSRNNAVEIAASTIERMVRGIFA
jgi:alcohol dehydrogenase class IV